MAEGEIKNWKKFLDNSLISFAEKYNQKPQDHLEVSDFTLIKKIGFGTFGRVILVKKKADGVYYAMKILDKERIVKSQQVEHTLNEKRILLAIDFVFIVKMTDFFKDNCYIYMVMPYVAGGDVFTVLRHHKRLTEDTCRFYAAQVVLALEYLHYLRIVYRDLKPENLLIDFDGYIKMADLGFCKRIKTRTYTLCGTPEYFAPEILQSQGYGFAVDWWCFGVLLYELYVGTPPFVPTDLSSMYKDISSGVYDATKLESALIKDLVKRLLQVNPSLRLGNLGNGPDGVKNHPWFKRLVWLDVLNKKVPPPIDLVPEGGEGSIFDKPEYVPLKTASEVLFQKEFEDF